MLVREIKTDEFTEGFHCNNEKVIPASPAAVGESLLWVLKGLWRSADSSDISFLVLCGNYIYILGLMLLRCLYRGRKYDDFKSYGLPSYFSEI